MRLGRSVDADGHILEPPDLWQKNLESKFKDRALGLARDKEGVESFIVEGHFSETSRGLGIAAAFGQPGEVAFSNEFSYLDGPPGAYDPHARVKLLDEEGIDAAVLYPTLGLLWEGEVNDAELALAYCRVYNDWITAFCRPYPDRLYPVAHISLMDVERAAAELKRVAKLGIKGVMLTPWPANGKAYGDTYYDPFWAVAQELGVPVGLHVIARPHYALEAALFRSGRGLGAPLHRAHGQQVGAQRVHDRLQAPPERVLPAPGLGGSGRGREHDPGRERTLGVEQILLVERLPPF